MSASGRVRKKAAPAKRNRGSLLGHNGRSLGSARAVCRKPGYILVAPQWREDAGSRIKYAMLNPQPPDAERLLETLRGTILGMVRKEGRDLTARQLAIFLICYLESEPQTMRRLAEKLNILQPAIARALDRLEEAGLVGRETGLDSRRSLRATRTARGQAFLRELEQRMADAAAAAGYAVATPRRRARAAQSPRRAATPS